MKYIRLLKINLQKIKKEILNEGSTSNIVITQWGIVRTLRHTEQTSAALSPITPIGLHNEVQHQISNNAFR
jgi:hypothetical protein